MKVQDLPRAAATTTLSIATLPVRAGFGAVRQTRDLFDRYDRRRSDEVPPRAKTPKATEPAKATAAEGPEVVAEQTDGLAEVAHQP